MSGIYVVSAQKPTAVTHSILGSVSSSNDLNLIICKTSLVEIYKVTSEGLKFLKQIGLWGIVENIEIIRHKNDTKDSLLVTTAKYDIMILTCELKSDGSLEVITKTHGNFKDNIQRTSSTHMITVVDQANQLIGIKCYDGILKLLDISTENTKHLNLSTLTMSDLNVIDMVFLQGYNHPTVAVICKEPNSKLNVKIYEIQVNTAKDLSSLLWKKDIYENQAFLISVPKPYMGIIVVGSQAISYYNQSAFQSNGEIQKSPSFLARGEIINYAQIDKNGQRYLLSNSMGELFLLFLMVEDDKVVDLRFELLGETSISNSITYIDNGVVFVGSKMGDSQLIKLTENPNENGSYISVLETYTNLGPILDMLLVDIEKQGQGQLITCSGGLKNGSLRIIRSGIGIQEMANIELTGVKSLWPLKINSSEFDDHLVLSYFKFTKIFSFFGEEFEDIELNGFDLLNQTLYCANVCHDQILQVTSVSVRLVKIDRDGDLFSCRLVNEWKLNEDELISVTASNQNECLYACRNKLTYLRISDGSLELVNSMEFAHEIACLDIYSWERKEHSADLCAVGLWGDISAVILTLPELKTMIHEPLKGDVIPRSILIENLEGITYLFVSLGDGSVISYTISRNGESILSDRRKVVLGTQPTILRKFSSPSSAHSTNNIFACSDRPSVISSGNQKLVYSSVNLKQVEYMCELNAKHYTASLALLSGGVLRIGKMDSIQKLHIRSVHINETVRRIAYQHETQTFGIISYRMDAIAANGDTKPIYASASTQCPNQYSSRPGCQLQPINAESQKPTDSASTSSQSNGQFDSKLVNSFMILDQNTFEVLQSIQLHGNEYILSIKSMAFDSEPNNAYYILGCSLVNEDEPEPKLGRLLVLKYSENKIVQVCEKEIKGAPYCLENFNGKLLVAISNTLKLFEMKDNQLNVLSSFSDSVFIVHLKCKSDFILVGDLMKSVSVLTYRADTNMFETVAKDHNPIWLSSVEIIDDDNYIISDFYNNISTLRKDGGQSNEDERKSLQHHGCIHLGEQINVFRHGFLGMHQQSNESLTTHISGSILAGSVTGSIILFCQLSNFMYKILNELQTRLSKYIITSGKIKYERWRMFESERRAETSKYFIDGDLIESFLELSPNEAASLVQDFKIDGSIIGHNNEEYSVNYFNKLVEELSRLH